MDYSEHSSPLGREEIAVEQVVGGGLFVLLIVAGWAGLSRLLSEKPRAASRIDSPGKQVPDERGEQADAHLQAGRYPQAAAGFASAVDALHSMYVIGEMKRREPSAYGDGVIVSGLVEAASASLEQAPRDQALRSMIGKSADYLGQIAVAAENGGYDPSLYLDAVRDLNNLPS